ncbi:hypothetical protein ACIQRZ_02235 [Streptomyces rubiginosohelvolus]|uniref:hypothetical protein n=1 Tax=Streptomyces rubiginosohelvolus TaxID=67362 RepID=UPI00381E3CFF
MVKAVNPDASFDHLFVIGELSKAGQSLNLGEVQIFIYLACMLGLYDGRPVATWGYSFVATPDSSPFSIELLEASDSLIASGLIATAGEFMTISERGQKELDRWERLTRFAPRVPYLRGATGAAVAMPLSVVKEGVELEPQLHNARALQHSRHLLDEAGISQIYRHFQVLESSLGKNVPDYMIPAVVWLSFLLEQDDQGGAAGGGLR